MLKQLAFVLPDGKVSACEQLYWHPQFILGDLKEQTLAEIWQSPRAKALFEMGQTQATIERSGHGRDSATAENSSNTHAGNLYAGVQ